MAKNCPLEDPENVKELIANRKSSLGRKENLVDVYAKYAKTLGVSFSEPKYIREDSLPFIPLQKELESIIKATHSRIAPKVVLTKARHKPADCVWSELTISLGKNTLTFGAKHWRIHWVMSASCMKNLSEATG